jgi:protoheme IX farnesyltransferase
MDRTKNRPLPSGRITENMALSFGLGLMGTCLLVLFYFINPLTSILGFIAAFVYVLLYTPMKTRTSLALFAGAIPGAIPPLMGWTSVTGSIGLLGVILFSILFIWQLPHFLSIAIYHMKDYSRADIKTHPGHIGIAATIHKIGVYTLALFFISMLPFYVGEVSEGYKYAVLLIGGGYFVYSLWGHALDEGTPQLSEWARRYFYGSLIYLPCVFILMIFFRNIS